MQEMKPIKEGKVREIYDNGDSLIMVATDRIFSHLNIRYVICKTPKSSAFAEITVLPYHYLWRYIGL